MELAHHRGLGNRISLDRHRAYMFRRKWEVRGVFPQISGGMFPEISENLVA